jgi:phosphoribosyl-dephospho-CoA transferase
MRAHDLLQISGVADLVYVGSELTEKRFPLWIERSLQKAPFVVVRRANLFDGMIPVGVRGSLRGQRFAAYLRAESVHKRIAPEQLSESDGCQGNARTQIIPALSAWAEIQEKLFNFSFVYGPTGSIGFELASGFPTATATSDLDLLFRVPERLPITAARELMTILTESACRIDAQLETPLGAVSLAEYARDETPLLLKQNRGPVLVGDAWQPLTK